MDSYISEIFNSIQGEGLYVGVKQVFVRFERCQLCCNYCDTPNDKTDFCRIEKSPNRCEYFKNPLSIDDVKNAIIKLWTESTRHVSLTGGEPLIYADFIKKLDIDYPLYLETNSGFPEKANQIKDVIDIAACDIKLPEHNATKNYSELLKKELETVSIFNNSGFVFVKIVVLPETTIESISDAVIGISLIDKDIPLVLQPVTNSKISQEKLSEIMDFAGKWLNDVRVIPQTQHILGVI